MFVNQVDLSELKKLAALLDDAGIAYEWLDEPKMGGASIKVPNGATWHYGGVSVIQHWGSYGGPERALECWCPAKENEPMGWLSAENCLERIREALHGQEL